MVRITKFYVYLVASRIIFFKGSVEIVSHLEGADLLLVGQEHRLV